MEWIKESRRKKDHNYYYRDALLNLNAHIHGTVSVPNPPTYQLQEASGLFLITDSIETNSKTNYMQESII